MVGVSIRDCVGKEQYPGMLEVELRIKEMYNRSNSVNENDLCSIIEMYMPDLSIDKVLESVKNLIGGETKNSLLAMYKDSLVQ